MLDYSLRLLTEPASEPVTLTEVKAHLVIEHTGDDTLLAALVTAARKHVEFRTGRAIVRQKWRLTRDCFADAIDLHRPPVISIDSVNYTDTDGIARVVGDDSSPIDGSPYYSLDLAEGRILKAYGASWPTPRNETGAVWVDFWAGYANTTVSPNVAAPSDLKIAVLLLVADLYEHRVKQSDMQLYTNTAFDLLIQPYWMPK